MNICPNCGKEVDDNARHCGHCGHKLQIEQKKTMLGMAAIDPAELQKRIAEARPAGRAEEADAEKPQDDAPREEPKVEASPDLAKTEVMESIRLPKPKGVAPGPVETEPETPDTSEELSEAEENAFATGPTQALEAVPRTGSQPSVAGDAETPDEEIPSQTTGPMEALESSDNPDEGGQWDASDQPDPLAATELEMPVVDLSKSGQVDAGSVDLPAIESTTEESPTGETTDDRAERASATDVEDAFFGAADDLSPPQEQGLAEQAPNNLAQLAGDPENKKRLILFVGVIAAVLLGCCILSAVLSFVL